MGKDKRVRVVVPRPDRVRTLTGTPFGWLAAGLSREGWLHLLTPQALSAYAFLCLVADRQGVSWYRRDRISRELGLDDHQVHQALARLEQLDLIAYRPFRPGAPDGFRQVLTLPPGGPPSRIPEGVLRLADRLASPLPGKPPRGSGGAA